MCLDGTMQDAKNKQHLDHILDVEHGMTRSSPAEREAASPPSVQTILATKDVGGSRCRNRSFVPGTVMADGAFDSMGADNARASSAATESRLHAETRMSDATLVRLFPYPVMHYDWPDGDELNDRLKKIILAARSSSPGVVKTNRGGWQSTTDLEKWAHPEIDVLLKRIHALAQQYLVQALGTSDQRFASGWSVRAWANLNQRGHFNRSHDHLGRNSFISGIYYVDSGDTDDHGSAGGRTIFEDWGNVPASILDDPDLSRTNFYMTPRDGRMLLFPASLMHSVEVYNGSRPRITIAFNLHHPGLGVARLRDRELSAHWGWRNFRGVMVLRRKIPEKMFALWLVPRVVARTPLPQPLSPGQLFKHVRTCVDHALALASERSEKR